MKVEGKIKSLLKYAILAPSNYNSQPWKFRIEANNLWIMADRSRQRIKNDPEGREMWISVGATAMNLEIAANYFGMGVKTKIDIDNNSETGVIMEFDQKWTNEKSRDKELFEAIGRRWTDRGDYDLKKIPKEELRKIARIAGVKGAGIEFFESETKKDWLSRLLYESNLVWFKSKDLMEELIFWLEREIEEEKNHQFLWLTKLPKMTNKMEYMANFSENESREKAKREAELVKKSAAILMVWSRGDEKIDWIRAGMAYERAALAMTASGIGSAFFNTVIELKSQRKKLEKMAGGKKKAQLILRIGYSQNKRKPTPRRRVKEVMSEI